MNSLDPIVFIDVGAAKGLPPLWRKIANKLRVIGFEPDPRSIEFLKSHPEGANSIYLPVALYKEKKTLDLYLTRDHRKSSIIPPNTEFLKKFSSPERDDVIGMEKIEADTLDNQLEENSISDVDFIKIDIQGSELYMLEGSLNALKKTYGLEIEISFTDRYKNQPLFGEVDMFMHQHGFDLIDLKSYYWKRIGTEKYGGWKGQAVIGKALYFKKDPPQDKSKALKAIAIANLYGYKDIAIEIFQKIKDQLSNDEKIEIRKNFEKRKHFFGQDTIARFFLKIAKFFESEKVRKLRQNSLLGNLDD